MAALGVRPASTKHSTTKRKESEKASSQKGHGHERTARATPDFEEPIQHKIGQNRLPEKRSSEDEYLRAVHTLKPAYSDVGSRPTSAIVGRGKRQSGKTPPSDIGMPSSVNAGLSYYAPSALDDRQIRPEMSAATVGAGTSY